MFKLAQVRTIRQTWWTSWRSLVSGYISSVHMLSLVSFVVCTKYRLPSRLSFPRDREWNSNNEDDDDNYDDDGGGVDAAAGRDDEEEPKNLA